MKTATLADLQNDISDVFAWIEAGEAVQITRDGHLFAIISPETVVKPVGSLPDFKARLAVIYPEPVGGASSEAIIDFLRGDY